MGSGPSDAYSAGGCAHGTAQKASHLKEIMTVVIQENGNYEENYNVEAELGRGTFGVVDHCVQSWNGNDAAIKRIRVIGAFNEDGYPSRRYVSVMQEVKALSSIVAHVNVIKVLDCWQEIENPTIGSLQLYIGMELCTTTLKNVMPEIQLFRADGMFYPSLAIEYFYQLLCGLEHIHLSGFTHFGLKPANCLISAHGNLKIADFGLCRLANEQSRSLAGVLPDTDDGRGTKLYASPEQKLNRDRSCHSKDTCGPPVDMFVAGIMFLELCDPTLRDHANLYALANSLRKGESSALRDKLPELRRAMDVALDVPTRMTRRSSNERPTARGSCRVGIFPKSVGTSRIVLSMF